MRLGGIIEESDRALESNGANELISKMRHNLRGQKEIEMKERELRFINSKQADLRTAIR